MNITIVGGGFGGVKAALELAKDSKNQITVITDKPDFQYYPALFSTATGYRHLQSWVPLGIIFAGRPNIRVVLDTVTAIDPSAKTITGKKGEAYRYQRCIIAIGMVTTYFGIKGLDRYAYGIKSAEEIKRLKHSIYTDIVENRKLDKRYVVVGAGPTGVELAASLGSYIRRLCDKFNVRGHGLRIDLIEAAPRVLPRMSEKASQKAHRRLQDLGVNIQTGKAVESASEDGLVVGGKQLSSRTVIWTSGVTNNPFFANNASHFVLAKNGRVEVDEFMKASKDVYVIGDNASTPYSGLAQTALHDAIFVASNLKRRKKKQQPKAYKAVMPPVIVPIGHNWAILEWRGITIGGRTASMLRRAADFIGYSDILPLGHALGVWRASYELEDDYFTPSLQLENKS